MSLEKSDAKLKNFFIFNSKYGQKEGHEEEKLLYFHPKNESLDIKVRQVGLAEAITRFSMTFNKDEDCESLHSQKSHQVYFQPEPSIWMVLTIAVGWVKRPKEHGVVKEYHSESIQDEHLKAILKDYYRAYSLQYFSFEKMLLNEKLGEDVISFFDMLINKTDLSTIGILSIWSGISFLPLDRQTFLRSHCMLSLLQATFPSIMHTAFLYKGSFIWSGFSVEDLKSLSDFLLSDICDGTTSLCGESSSLSSSESSQSSFRQISYKSRFVGKGGTPSLIVYIHDNKGDLKAHHLVSYCVDKATVCFTFPESEKLNPVMYEKIFRLIDDKVVDLAKEIGNQVKCKSNANDSFKYFYHNRMNLATKSSVHSFDNIQTETLQTIVDMHSDLLKVKSSELIVKTSQDFWIVGKWNNGRESYIVISRKNANLVEVTDEVNRLCCQDFQSIFTIS